MSSIIDLCLRETRYRLASEIRTICYPEAE